jgi:hypothetical protein
MLVQKPQQRQEAALAEHREQKARDREVGLRAHGSRSPNQDPALGAAPGRDFD